MVLFKNPRDASQFQNLARQKYADCLQSDNLQFDFKKNYGCGHALFSLTESVQYFNKRGSKIYCAFLGASKAFDKVLIYGLLAKLIKRNAPVHFIRILQSCMVQCFALFGYMEFSNWQAF